MFYQTILSYYVVIVVESLKELWKWTELDFLGAYRLL